MKKIFASVCVIVMCATMVSCVDDVKVQSCIGARLNYEQAARDLKRLDANAPDDVRNAALCDVEDARKKYLTEFASLSENERTVYYELEAECKKADENYLDSAYKDTTKVENRTTDVKNRTTDMKIDAYLSYR